jgi:hypothetical protein
MRPSAVVCRTKGDAAGRQLVHNGNNHPVVDGRAAVSEGVSARFIGVLLTCRLADRRIIQFQWFDTDGRVYQATVSSGSQ